ncbi:hypothetical protein ACWCQM_16865 [Streptomyces sp. NPDC002125]
MNRDNPSPDEPKRSREGADRGRGEKERRGGREGEPKPAKPSGLTVRTTGLVLDTGDGRDEEEIDGIPTEREV